MNIENSENKDDPNLIENKDDPNLMENKDNTKLNKDNTKLNKDETKLNKNKQTTNTKKKNLGQFYTSNYEYILQGMKIPKDTKLIVEPFAGNGDLVEFAKSQLPDAKFECYDIDPKNKQTVLRDTIKDPPSYKDKYVITNPPYLARNKCKDKTLFDKYDTNDLYKCFILELIENVCSGGILIVPLNFWSSIRPTDIKLRKSFLSKYDVKLLNIFEEQVFEDTNYAVCSFQFNKRINTLPFDIIVYPSKIKIKTELTYDNRYMIGGEIYNLLTDKTYTITRLTKKNKADANTNILVKCIDDNKANQIGLKMVSDDERYIDSTPNQSARTYATLIITPQIDKEKQTQLVEKFNKFLKEYRDKYHSLFLANYRENKDIARKRISFDLVYQIVKYILGNFDEL